MRICAALVVLVLAACTNPGVTRRFSLVRDAAPETVAATNMPLSVPPSLAKRPARPGVVAMTERNAAAPEPASLGAGQDALVQAAGPVAPAGVRTAIDENSGLIYPDPAFVDHLMNWTPPAGYTPVITQARAGGWFSRLF